MSLIVDGGPETLKTPRREPLPSEAARQARAASSLYMRCLRLSPVPNPMNVEPARPRIKRATLPESPIPYMVAKRRIVSLAALSAILSVARSSARHLLTAYGVSGAQLAVSSRVAPLVLPYTATELT